MLRTAALEQEQFECFAIPSHVFVDGDEAHAVTQPALGLHRRDWLLRELDLLGPEATPSPL